MIPGDRRNPAAWRRLLRLPSRSRSQIAADVDDEVAFHLAMREDELRARGLAPAEAAREARRRFGDVDEARRDLRRSERRADRAARHRAWFAAIRQDLAFAGRRAAREPGFTAMTVATLSLGLGATVAMASVARRMLLAPLPYVGADRLVMVGQKTKDGSLRVSASSDLVEAMRGTTPSLERVEWLSSVRLMELRDGVPRPVQAGIVSQGLLDYLDVMPALGRSFAPDERRAGGPPVMMLSWTTWRRRFEGSPSVLGSSLTLDDRAYTIVGVMPRLFDPSVFGVIPRSELWMPQRDTAGRVFPTALGVLRPGATLEQVAKEVAVAQSRMPEARRLASLVPNVQPLMELAGSETRTTLLVMAAAVVLVLLIGCLNVANLLLARGAAREREFAVRTAIGASRGRLIRQLLVESGMLALLGGAVGLGLARVMLSLVATWRPAAYAALEDVQLDGVMLGVSFLLALLTAITFGLVPALFTSRGREGTLRGGRSVGPGRAGQRLRRVLAFGEVGCSVALVVAAVMLLRSAAALQEMRLGYDVDPIVTLRVQRVPGVPTGEDTTGPAPRRGNGMAAALAPGLERLRALPGVEGVALGDGGPGNLGGCMCEFLPEGAPLPAEPPVTFMIMSPADTSRLRVVGTRLIAGRAFSGDTSAHEAMVTATTARKFWKGKTALGQRFRLSRDEQPYTVVAVVEDQRTPEGWTPGDSIHVLPFDPSVGDEPAVIVRLAASGAPSLEALARAVESASPQVRVLDAQPFQQVVDEARAPQRFTLILLGGFAACALLLSAIGLYGVMAYGVEQRRREIGIRMALGATRASVGRLVLVEGLAITLAGALAGGVGSLALTRMLKQLLVGVTPKDAAAYAVALVVVLVAALAALWFPTWRASSVDPMTAVSAD